MWFQMVVPAMAAKLRLWPTTSWPKLICMNAGIYLALLRFRFQIADILSGSASLSVMQTLFTTCAGSHMWSMDIEQSDIDLFHAYMVPSRVLLEGRRYPETLPQKISLKDGREYDEVWWEIGHLVDQLIKGNANAIWFTMSPLVVCDSPALQELRDLVQNNLSRATYCSLRGIANSHLSDAHQRPSCAAKSLRTAMRTITFGLEMLINGRLAFLPARQEITFEEVQMAMSDLGEAYRESRLPDRPDEEPFRNYLYRLRMENLASDGQGHGMRSG